ncbi:MAG TPA: hypothetical protein VJR89_01135, partial [Polyangiales bacterium]|nr:hypothetical protein [Polyangiales bacterium]
YRNKRLSINGTPVPVGPDGSFSADVPLAEGENDVVISAQDALGRSEQQTLPKVTVDTKGPKLKGRVVW